MSTTTTIRSTPPPNADPPIPASLRLADEDLTEGSPRWTRYALWSLLAATAVLYLWGLATSGWANAFYSAAAQAGADNWTAFLFGSSDIANSITVDKPPASIWVMALSVKVFGLNSWAMLVPQALMGVGSVWLLFATVRRWYGDIAGLIAGAVLAVTPIAVLMFRFNNPDALLVLLMVAAAYAVTRAIDPSLPQAQDGATSSGTGRSTRWIALAGVLMGFAFLTKSLQALLVLPPFVIAYLVAAPTGLGRRIRDLAVAFGAFVASAGWWILLVELWPADSRPYIGGSQANSAWELIMGYNGLGRITGDEAGSVTPGGGGGQGGMWGETGLLRMFDGSWAGGIAWLLPAALILGLVGFWLTRGQPRTGLLRAGLIIWTGWLVVTGLVFSLASGIIHEYYAVALAPAIGALVGIGAVMLWRLRDHLAARITLAVAVTASALYGASLLVRAGGVYATLGVLVSVVAVLAGIAIAVGPTGRWRCVTASVALAAVLAGPVAFSLQTAATAHTGSLPSVGPSIGGSSRGGPGGAMRGGPMGIAAGLPPGGPTGGGGMGGLLDASTPSAELVSTLTENASDYTWIAATIGSQNGAGYQLATGFSVMPIGGFNGSDPSPTLAQFQAYVAGGQIHWFIGSGGMGGGPGGNGSNEISTWVQEHFTATTVDGVTLYDLTQPVS